MKKTLRAALTKARTEAGSGRVAGTNPSHPLEHYAGEFEHPAYGCITVSHTHEGLRFAFSAADLPLAHFHYDRFDTPDDELRGKWSVNFTTNPLGDIGSIRMVLDEEEAEFRRRPPTLTPDALAELAGTYETASGVKWEVLVKDGKRLYLCFPGIPDSELVPYKKGSFRIPQFPDRVYEFEENPESRVLRVAGPEGVYVLNGIRN